MTKNTELLIFKKTIQMLRPIDATIFFFERKPTRKRLIYNNLNAMNNNLNAGPKSDKIAKDFINSSKSRNSKNPSFVIPD